MKAYLAGLLGLAVCVSTPQAMAHDAMLHYQFTAGQTNVFAVEISVLGENGSEVSSGNIVVVTKAVTTNTVTLACQGNLTSEIKRAPMRIPGAFPGYYPGMATAVFPNGCEIELDLKGNEIRDGGDYVMAAPLGKLVQALFAPLPEKAEQTARDMVAVLDEPFWLGPSDSFLTLHPNGQPWTMNYYSYMGGQRNSMATLLAARQTAWRVKKSTPERVEWHQHSQLSSIMQTGDAPRFLATSETEITFDRQTGWCTRRETEAEVHSQTEASSRHAKVSFSARRLTGDEFVAALAPPPPPPPVPKLEGEELDQVAADLRSDELDKYRAALNRLNAAELTSPAPELIKSVASLAFNDDAGIRQSVVNFLSRYGTTNESAVLVKLLKDPEDGVCETAAKTLARLQDEYAIVPLTEVIAGGVRFNQFNQIQDSQLLSNISAALVSYGAAAEEPVVSLLEERSIEARRQACLILKQVGTTASLSALQRVVGDPNPQVNQAAADAIRAIKQRQS